MSNAEKFEVLNEKFWIPEEGLFDEPSDSRSEDYRPWEATPISEHVSEVSTHQRAVEAMTFEMLKGGSYPYLTPQLEDYVSLIYFSREANRKTKNAQSYHNIALSDDELFAAVTGDDRYDVWHAQERMLQGRAKPDEIRSIREHRMMASAELAKLTHMYGYRLEHIEPMRAEALQGVEALGGVVFDTPTEEYSIIAADNSITRSNHLTFGLTMTRVRHLATIGTTEVKERSSFIVVLNNQTRLDSELIKNLKSVEVRGEPEDALGQPSSWVQAMKSFGLDAEVKKYLEANDFETILPMSTTIFEHDPEVSALIKEKHAAQESLSTPDIIKKAREDYIRSMGGIVIVNGSNKKK